MEKSKSFSSGQLASAAFLILLGSLFLLNNFNLIPGNILGYWPVLVIFLGVTFLFRGKIMTGLWFVFLGSLFFASMFYGWHIWGKIWPVFIIWAGFSALFGPKLEKNLGVSSGEDSRDTLQATALFDELKLKATSKTFKGGKVDVIFGGGKLDLTGIEIAKEGASLEVNAIFGGVEIFVSDKYRVEASGTGVFGGWTNEYRQSEKKEPVLKISGGAVFGGVEVKN